MWNFSLFGQDFQKRKDEEIEEIAEFYDYLEIQPIANNQFLIRNEIVKDEEALKDINRKIVALRRKIEQIGSCYL